MSTTPIYTWPANHPYKGRSHASVAREHLSEVSQSYRELRAAGIKPAHARMVLVHTWQAAMQQARKQAREARQ